MCPNMTRIFPPTSAGRRTAFESNYSDNGSNMSLKKRSGYVKINYKLVRQCLIYASPDEKCKVMDTIRLVSLNVNIPSTPLYHCIIDGF